MTRWKATGLLKLAAFWLLAGSATAGPPSDSDKQLSPPGKCPERYNVEAKFLANPDESVLIAGVIGWCRKNNYTMLWDERYADAARLWSGYLVESGTSPDRLLEVDRLRFELRTRGVTDAIFLPYSAEGPPEKMPKGLLPFLDREARRGRFTHFAVGVTRTKNQERMVTTLVLGRRPALIDPLPVCPLPASRLVLRVRLLRGYRHPTWLMTQPDGSVVKEALLYEEGAWHGKVPLDGGSGTYQMELTVNGPAGLEVAALFPLFVGVERPRLPKVKLRPAPGRYRTPQQAEAALVKMVNQARIRQKLSPLVVDEQLSKLAREHSLELLGSRHAVHRTSTTGALQDRLRRQRIPFARALENVSLSSSPELAHERFMESPGHRINIVDPHVTLLGIGIAMERGSQEDILAVCEVFVEPLESADASLTVRNLVELINQRRMARGRFALGHDQDLSREALRSVRRLVALGDKADAQREGDRVVKSLTEGEMEIKDVQVRYFKTTNLRRILTAKQIMDEAFNRLGIGLAKTGSRSKPDEYWIALILAGR